MKAVSGLLLAVSLSLLTVACSQPPSGQELFDRASSAEQQQASANYQLELSGAASERGQEQSGSLKISGSSDLQTSDNSVADLQLRIGNVTLSQIGDAIYLQSRAGAIKISAEEKPAQSSGEQELSREVNNVVSRLGETLLSAVEGQSEVSTGPDIAGQETWVWEPQLSELDYQQVLKDGVETLFQLAEENETLGQEIGDDLKREQQEANDDIDSISPQTLDKIRTAVSGIDIKAYFAQDSGLNLGADLQIGWNYRQLAKVFGAEPLGTTDQSAEINASLEYRVEYSDQPLQLMAPDDAVDVDSPKGQRVVKSLFEDNQLAGSLIPLLGDGFDQLITPSQSSLEEGPAVPAGP